MPSLAVTLWLVLAAATDSDPLSPPPHGRAPEKTVPVPIAAVPYVKPTPVTGKPSEPKSPKAPAMPVAPTAPAASKPSKPSAKGSESRVDVEEPAEEIVADPSGRIRIKSARNGSGSRKVAPVDRPDPVERRTGSTSDRYAAVVPPGLTLAALRSQIAKGPQPVQDTSPMASERSAPSQNLSDIEKAREALRQETARLEALLKAAGSCGVGIGAPMGDGMSSTTPVSAAALREASTEQIDSVSKAMKGMKPEQAAALIARLDRGLAAEILRRMKAVDAGAILGLLKPEMAADLATEIALRKPIYGKDKKGAQK